MKKNDKTNIYAVCECLSNTIIQVHYDLITDLEIAKKHKKNLEVLCNNQIVILTEVLE